MVFLISGVNKRKKNKLKKSPQKLNQLEIVKIYFILGYLSKNFLNNQNDRFNGRNGTIS